jgi:hypothetical protein
VWPYSSAIDALKATRGATCARWSSARLGCVSEYIVEIRAISPAQTQARTGTRDFKRIAEDCMARFPQQKFADETRDEWRRSENLPKKSRAK